MNDYERQRMERIAANNAKMAVSRASGPRSRLLPPVWDSRNGWQRRQGTAAAGQPCRGPRFKLCRWPVPPQRPRHPWPGGG